MQFLILALNVLWRIACTLPWYPLNSMKAWPKIHPFWDNSVSFSNFLHQIAEINKSVHFIRFLPWFCFYFRCFLTLKKKWCNPGWRIQDGGSNCIRRTSLPRRIVLSSRLISGSSNQCISILLCLWRTKTMARGGFPSTPLLPRWGLVRVSFSASED